MMMIDRPSVVIVLALLFILESSQDEKSNHGYDFESDTSSLERGPDLSPFELDMNGTFRREFAISFLMQRGVTNTACSPLAAVISLGQLAMGAEDVGLSELLNASGVPRKTQVKPKFKYLVKRLMNSPGVAIIAANKIFVTIKVHVLGKFDKDMDLVFRTNVLPLHFEQVGYTKIKMNKWIEYESNRSAAVDIDFQALIGRESSILINVARISGNWNKPFRNVGKQAFHSPNGLIHLPMICRQGHYNYHISYDLHAQIVQLPFKEKKVNLVIVLPFRNDGLTRMLERIKKAPHKLNIAMKNMTITKVVVTLPKFSIHTNADMKSMYKSMGLQRIFQGNSGLSRIILNTQMIVQLVWQVAVFDINENGTETTGPPAKELHRNQKQNNNIFNARHPFLFYVNFENEQVLVGTYAAIILSLVLVNCKKGGFHIHVSSEERENEKEKIDSYEFDLRGSIRKSFAMNYFLSFISVRSMACSPLSAMLPLAKLALGARGDAELELLQAIGMDQHQLASGTKHLIKMLERVPGVKLTVSSRIFLSNKIKLNSSFVKATNKIFKSSVQQVDFDRPGRAEKKINAWIKEEMENASDVKLDYHVQGSSGSIIMNIVTFVGDWEQKFTYVANKPFYTPKGVISVPMMYQQDYFRYYKSDELGAQVIEIPYLKKEASFVVVLPFSKTGLPSVLSKIKRSPHLLNNAMKRMFLLRVILTIPKFKIFTTGNIVQIYDSVGVRQIFSRNSGLTGIIEYDIMVVNSAYQVTVIDVNEKGTQAVAATAVELVHISKPLDQIIFNAEHPFLFYIKSANEQIFAGTYAGN